MRKFKFNLERLLRIRAHEEQDWEIKLGRTVAECVRIQTDIKHRTSEIDRVLKTRGELQGHENDHFSMEMYKRRMKKEIGELDNELEKAELKHDEVRLQFLEVSKRRKVIAKLKEKRELEYYKHQRKIEHEMIDEINNGRAANRTNV